MPEAWLLHINVCTGDPVPVFQEWLSEDIQLGGLLPRGVIAVIVNVNTHTRTQGHGGCPCGSRHSLHCDPVQGPFAAS
eukprot:1090222-Pelagomonas_calceolata.AAC.3